MALNKTFRVAVLVDTATAWGRRLIRGVLSYEKTYGPWDVWIEHRGQNETFRLPDGWKGDGIIARVSTMTFAEYLRKQKIPVVNVSGIRIPGLTFPRVCTDNDSLAQLAVNHFVDRGIQNIAYIGLQARAYSQERQDAMVRVCQRAGCRFTTYTPSSEPNVDGRWKRDRKSIGKWLENLPKPVGVLAWGVRRGSDVIEEAIHRNLRVPEDVAVLGDDDSLLCEAVHPALSGVIVPSEQIGLEAAEMLDQLMHGKKLRKQNIALEPTGIVSRASTDTLAVDDDDVVEAIRLIRSQSHKPLRVIDVVNTLAAGRRSLERRFQETLHRTIGEEIARVHLERAKFLLATTELPIPAVAQASGYGSPEYLATLLKRQTGLTPRQYRKQCQGK
jgi:LacI family transcriptional regulator